MKKTIRISLKDFPNTQEQIFGKQFPVTNQEVEFRIEDLYHHQLIDTFGENQPDKGDLYRLYSSLISPDKDFRFIGNGLGSHKEARISEINKCGKAFCRWFLHSFLHISHFAHMDDVLNSGVLDQFNGIKVERVASGDTPDYLCANAKDDVFLAEAKGRTKAISFDSSEYVKWRKQFDTVSVKDSQNRLVSIKGYIVATRLANNSQPRIFSHLLAEDPWSPGDPSLIEAYKDNLALNVRNFHYSGVLKFLKFPLISALLIGKKSDIEFLTPVIVWKSILPNLTGKSFVGGYFSLSSQLRTCFLNHLPSLISDIPLSTNILGRVNLDKSEIFFFGLEYEVFKKCLSIAKGKSESYGIEVAIPDTLPSDLSLLRDGTILGPIDYFVIHKEDRI